MSVPALLGIKPGQDLEKFAMKWWVSHDFHNKNAAYCGKIVHLLKKKMLKDLRKYLVGKKKEVSDPPTGLKIGGENSYSDS